MDTKTTSAKNTEWKSGVVEAAGRWEPRRLYHIARQATFWWTFLMFTGRPGQAKPDSDLDQESDFEAVHVDVGADAGKIFPVERAD
jgi:hypothetical protein